MQSMRNGLVLLRAAFCAGVAAALLHMSRLQHAPQNRASKIGANSDTDGYALR